MSRMPCGWRAYERPHRTRRLLSRRYRPRSPRPVGEIHGRRERHSGVLHRRRPRPQRRRTPPLHLHQFLRRRPADVSGLRAQRSAAAQAAGRAKGVGMKIILFAVLLVFGLAIALGAILAVIGSILYSWRYSSHVDADELRKAGL